MSNAMNNEQFLATRHAPTDAEWNELQALVSNGTIEPLEREQCCVYDGGYLIEQRPDGFYPHGWFYDPRRHENMESAESDLCEWRAEFL